MTRSLLLAATILLCLAFLVVATDGDRATNRYEAERTQRAAIEQAAQTERHRADLEARLTIVAENQATLRMLLIVCGALLAVVIIGGALVVAALVWQPRPRHGYYISAQPGPRRIAQDGDGALVRREP